MRGRGHLGREIQQQTEKPGSCSHLDYKHGKTQAKDDSDQAASDKYSKPKFKQNSPHTSEGGGRAPSALE